MFALLFVHKQTKNIYISIYTYVCVCVSFVLLSQDRFSPLLNCYFYPLGVSCYMRDRTIEMQKDEATRPLLMTAMFTLWTDKKDVLKEE